MFLGFAPGVEGSRCPEEGDAVCRVVGVQRAVEQERLDLLGKLELLLIVRKEVGLRSLDRVTVRDRVDQRVEVEGRKVGILRLDEHHARGVVPEKKKTYCHEKCRAKDHNKLFYEKGFQQPTKASLPLEPIVSGTTYKFANEKVAPNSIENRQR